MYNPRAWFLACDSFNIAPCSYTRAAAAAGRGLTMETIAGLSVEHQVAGARRHRAPLLLVHGMWGGSWYWANYIRFAADAGWDVWAINLRGHHGSRSVKDFGRVSVNDYADDVGAVLDAIGPAVVVGHSMGGLIAQMAARRADVRAAVFLTSAAPRGIVVLRWAVLSRLTRYVPAMVASRPFKARDEDAVALMLNRMTPAARADALPRFVPESGHAGLELAIGLIAVAASSVRCPTLVMGASDDQITPVAVQRRIAARYGSEYVEAAGHAHMLMLEEDWQAPWQHLLAWLAMHAG